VRRCSIARWRHREQEDEAEAPGAGRLHLGKADAALGVGGTQAGGLVREGRWPSEEEGERPVAEKGRRPG
jgi:hypothetical protein